MKTILGTMTFSDQVDMQSAAHMISSFKATGHSELDTAFVYNHGETELLLGQLHADNALAGTLLAGKANPWAENGLTPSSLTYQLNTSLERLGMSSLDLFYLHAPDLNVPVRDTLKCVADLHEAGKFRRFGLSNFAAWQVAEIVEICRQEGWPVPSVYQGMYNALTRDVERELLPCLNNYDIAFYAYNPLAGGLLSGKHQAFEAVPSDGRFANFNGYQERYWKAEYFDVVNTLSAQCRECEIEPAAAALRWLVHHSAISDTQDKENKETPLSAQNAIIVGASSIAHFEQNMQAIDQASLPQALVDAFDQGWDAVRPACIKYFRP